MEKYYQTMLTYIHNRPLLKKTIIQVCRFFPYITFILYPCVLIYLWITKNELFLTTLIKPLSAFLIVTIFRKIMNRPRPYEAMDIHPLFHHKQGESFPSRHTVSAFIIALVCFNVHFGLGLFTLFVAIIISGSRILAGVHYISDVLSAIVIAIIIYFI